MSMSELPAPNRRSGWGLAVISLVLANLVPLAGVFAFHWDAAMIVLLYWVENLIVGFYNILKMALVPMKPPLAHLGKLFMIPFFCVHFGGFCAVHGMFLTMFLKIGSTSPMALEKGLNLPGPLIFLNLLYGVVIHIWSNLPPGFQWPILAIFVSHGISFVQNFLIRGEYRTLGIDALMGQPYKRIVLMHITILLGGFIAMAFKSSVAMLALMVVLKIAMDLRLHLKERTRGAETSPAAVVLADG